MMRFLQIIVLIFLSLCTAMVGAICIGRKRPSTPLFVGMGICGGVACYEGIEFLKTSADYAHAHLQQLPYSTWDSQTNRFTFSKGDIDWVELHSDSKNMIFSVTIHLRPGVLRLGAVIQTWGIPCGIESIGAGNTHLGFTDAQIYLEGDYPNSTIWIPVIDNWVQPFMSVTGIDLFPKTGEMIDDFRAINSCSFTRPPWKGFKNYESP